MPVIEYVVVWNGGPLLPDRPTRPDGRWEGIARYYAEIMPKEPHVETRVKRLYNKVNRAFWDARGHPAEWIEPLRADLGVCLPLGRADPEGETETERARFPGDSSQDLSPDAPIKA